MLRVHPSGQQLTSPSVPLTSQPSVLLQSENFNFTHYLQTFKFSYLCKWVTVQSIALCGTSFFLVVLTYTEGYYGSLTCMALAVACCGFHNSGILVNPQDIAPRHAGSVFGEKICFLSYVFPSWKSWESHWVCDIFFCDCFWFEFLLCLLASVIPLQR